MNGLRAWGALTPRDRVRFVALLLALPAVSALLRVAGYVRSRRLVEWLSPVRSPRRAREADLRAAQRLARLAAVAGRRGAVNATCLRQALLVYGWLRWRGLLPELQLGVRKQEGRFDAHAWVVLEGVALMQEEVEHTPLRGPDRLAGTAR